ncbi:MAG: hypothetical protein E7271_12700 [Lachnospiraceae bacterium]|nr:hypothetical protein [Lachnospiraceae bacterium]
MNKKVKVLLDILIVIACIAFVLCLMVVFESYKNEIDRKKKEDPVKQTMSVFEYRLKYKAYGEILDSYYTDKMKSPKAPEGMEDYYKVAEYAHNSFMSRVYAQKGDDKMIKSNAAKLKEQREQLGSYQYTADEIDDIIKNAP